jgi:hypothetical protein
VSSRPVEMCAVRCDSGGAVSQCDSRQARVAPQPLTAALEAIPGRRAAGRVSIAALAGVDL